MKEITRFL